MKLFDSNSKFLIDEIYMLKKLVNDICIIVEGNFKIVNLKNDSILQLIFCIIIHLDAL